MAACGMAGVPECKQGRARARCSKRLLCSIWGSKDQEEKRAQFQNRGSRPNVSCSLVVPVITAPTTTHRRLHRAAPMGAVGAGHGVTQEDMRVSDSPAGHPFPPFPCSDQ